MSCLASIPAMIVLAGVLSAPLIFEAQISLTDPVSLASATTAPAPVGGARVDGARNENIGSIRGPLFSDSDAECSVVLSLDGSHGIAGKLIVLPGSLIQAANDNLMIAGAIRDGSRS